jgi:hypothetical protein
MDKGLYPHAVKVKVLFSREKWQDVQVTEGRQILTGISTSHLRDQMLPYAQKTEFLSVCPESYQVTGEIKP